eukprot:7321566-Prymnesium_polylepis.1
MFSQLKWCETPEFFSSEPHPSADPNQQVTPSSATRPPDSLDRNSSERKDWITGEGGASVCGSDVSAVTHNNNSQRLEITIVEGRPIFSRSPPRTAAGHGSPLSGPQPSSTECQCTAIKLRSARAAFCTVPAQYDLPDPSGPLARRLLRAPHRGSPL